MFVTHKTNGDGLVTNYNGKHITVEFDNDENRFQMPRAFEEGHLISEYPDFLENYKRKNEINKQIEILSNLIKEKKELLSDLII